MRTQTEALEYSKQNPTELVEFMELFDNNNIRATGFVLNGKREGNSEYYYNGTLKYRDVYNSKTSHTEHIHFLNDGNIGRHFFSHGITSHGEYIEFNEDISVGGHKFYNLGTYIEELDELLDADRDEAFYFTLAMYGIDKEYTFQ